MVGEHQSGSFLSWSWPAARQGPRTRSLIRLFLSPVGTVDVGKARLMFWDLGGQEELQSLWDKVR